MGLAINKKNFTQQTDKVHTHPSKGNIRRKFLRIFIILGVLPMIALGIVGIIFLMISRQQSIQEAEILLLKQKTEEVARFVDETLDTFEVQVGYSYFVPLYDGFSSGLQLPGGYNCRVPYDELCDEQAFLLEGLLAANRNLAEVAFINTIPPAVRSNCVVTEIDSCLLNLPPLGKETKRLSAQFDIPKNCGLEMRPNKAEDCQYYGYYPSSEMFRTISSGRDYISNPYKTPNGYFITIAAPVRNKVEKDNAGNIIRGGEIIAGLRGELSLKPLETIFMQARLGEKGYAYLLDDTGAPIASTFDKNFPAGASINNVVTEKSGKGVGVTDVNVYKSAFGDIVIGSAQPVGRLNLTTVVEWPYTDAYSVVYSITNQVILFILIILVAIIVLSRTLAKQITRPISVLQFAAARIGKGSFEPISEIKTGDELELLAHSLNDMSKELKDLDELKRRASEAKLLELNLAKEKELVEVKDSFLDTASHQLRTPISAIKWQLELLQEEKISPEGKELLSGAYEHAEFLSEISTDLINAASYGIGYKPKDTAKVSLLKIIAEVNEHFAGHIEKNKIKYIYTPPAEDVVLTASFPAFRVLFENIIGNAIRYTKSEGQITVTIIKQDNAIEVRVADTGIGIPAEEHKMIFTQFFRAVNAIDTRNVGTGLGLYIARNIVLGHGGNIWFTSELGKGTTFFMSFLYDKI